MFQRILSLVSLSLMLSAPITATAKDHALTGKIVFESGRYVIMQTDQDSTAEKVSLKGIYFNELRSFEGQHVKVVGDIKANSLDVYKIYTIEDNALTLVYDWDAIDEALYSN